MQNEKNIYIKMLENILIYVELERKLELSWTN